MAFHEAPAACAGDEFALTDSMNSLPARSVLSAEACRKAAAYSAQHRGIALIVSVDARVVFEDYPNEGAPDRVSDLASGTKSFAGIAAVAAVADGLLALDEPLGCLLYTSPSPRD